MTLKLSKVQFASQLAGLDNYENDTFNFTVNGHSLTPGQTTRWTTSWPINNNSAISTITLNYAGLETVWRYASGAINTAYAANTYSVETLTYYTSSRINVETYVTNQTGSTVVIPMFIVNVRVSLFKAPF